MSLGNSPQWMYSSGAASFYDHEIDGSLRFNDNDSAYLSRTPASAGNRRTWTWSGWVKRGALGSNNDWIFGSSGGVPISGFYFDPSTETLRYRTYNGSSENVQLHTNAKFRDPSAWYHIVVAYDTTQATASNRIKFYVNGEQITSFSTATYPTLNYQGGINNTQPQDLGAYATASVNKFDGYMAEVNFIDGQQLDPTSFGETKSGVWIPKEYSGSYGTNGFHLEFAGNANDSSGNGNNFTAYNISSYDYVPDSPTNNFATLNSIFPDDHTLSQGNLQAYYNAAWDSTLGTIAPSTGKWYFEAVLTSKSWQIFGVDQPSIDGKTKHVGATNGSKGLGFVFDPSNTRGDISYNSNNSVYDDGNLGINVGDIVSIAMDLDNNNVKFYLNNALEYNLSDLLEDGANYTFGLSLYNSTAVANFGQDSSFAGNKTAQGNSDGKGFGDFYYTPPSGYLALCTANLTAAEGVDPNEDNSPRDHFNILTWQGRSSFGTSSYTGLGFQPDFTWIKCRNVGHHHYLMDVLRGPNNVLATSLTNSEPAFTPDEFVSFDSDGITVEFINGGGRTNYSSDGPYVAWNWKANGSGVSNTDGSITSTVSANTDAGFSIVTYTGTQANATVGHGLNQAPEVVIAKARSRTNGWPTLHAPSGNYGLRLNQTAGNNSGNGNLFYRNTAPTSSIVYLGANDESNASNHTHIMYCFHSVEGFSKFGSYTGNGSTDGPFVYTGFRPAFVITKKSSGISNWNMTDSAREPYNPDDAFLIANSALGEFVSSSYEIDLLSNGFKPRTTEGGYNTSGQTYIYMAFAENPFKYANAR